MEPFLINLQAVRSTTLSKRNSSTVFSGEFCEFLKITFFTERLWATASDMFIFLRGPAVLNYSWGGLFQLMQEY